MHFRHPVSIMSYYTLQKSFLSRHRADVERADWIPVDIDPGSLIVVQIQNNIYFGFSGFD